MGSRETRAVAEDARRTGRNGVLHCSPVVFLIAFFTVWFDVFGIARHLCRAFLVSNASAMLCSR